MTMMPDTIEKKVKNLSDNLEFYDGGDGVEWEVWIDNKNNKKYVIPIQIQRFWDDAEELIDQDW